MEPVEYLIVGGGLSAVYALQVIRERDKTGRIILVTDEKHLPYDRVPLSKGYLVGKVKEESLFPKKIDFFEKQKIEIVMGVRATSLNARSKVVKLADGREFSFEQLLLATGGKPRKLPLPGSDLKGIYYLRTVDDCDTIKEEILRTRKAVVVGGGFIGCELAAAFITKGIDVTIVEAFPSLLSLAFDAETARWIENYFISKGVNVMTNAFAVEFVGENGRVTGIRTKDGTFVAGDFVVVGVGIIPSTELAEQAGLKVDRGIMVDEFLETSAPNIFAAGDVARFYHPTFGHHLRVEHYDIAVKHGKLVGASMAGDKKPFTEMPYFFSYMFDLTINAYGDMGRRETIIRRGELGMNGFFQFFFADGRLQAFISMNRPNDEVQVAKDILLRRPSLDQLQLISDESVGMQKFVAVQP
jgi:3-phenylpropionate/trans-cinnamate dioxygenase ferredoxin reductase subunit